jgi:SH3 domain protein
MVDFIKEYATFRRWGATMNNFWGESIMNLTTKVGTLVLIGLMLVAATSAAETKYVTEELNITLRTGPGTDRKIIAFPNAGDPLEIVTPGEEYTEVMTRGGKQGFVLTRYLTDKEPSAQVLARLEQKYNQLKDKYDELQQKSSQLSGSSKNLSDELDKTRKELEQLTVAHETLKNESKEYLQLKGKYEKSVKEAAEARSKADKADKELQQLYSSEINTGILYGGGLIVLGFITGFIVKRPRRRSPLM